MELLLITFISQVNCLSLILLNINYLWSFYNLYSPAVNHTPNDLGNSKIYHILINHKKIMAL